MSLAQAVSDLLLRSLLEGLDDGDDGSGGGPPPGSPPTSTQTVVFSPTILVADTTILESVHQSNTKALGSQPSWCYP
jgi:hypothetical protein